MSEQVVRALMRRRQRVKSGQLWGSASLDVYRLSVCLFLLTSRLEKRQKARTRSAFISLWTTAKRRERFKGHWDRLRASSNDATTPARCQITSRC